MKNSSHYVVLFYSQDTVKLKACLAESLINLENFQKAKVCFWILSGFNSFDFKIDYKLLGLTFR
jgi:hypothetical protein